MKRSDYQLNNSRKPNSGVRLLSALPLVAAISLAQAENMEQRFDIPAQPLSSALMAFSKQSSYIVIAAGDLVAGKKSPRLDAFMAPEQALLTLLENSGLSYQETDKDTITIVRSADSSESDVSSGDQRQKRMLDEHNKQQIEEMVVTATKREENVFDVPISVSAISGTELQERGIDSLEDLSVAVPGLLVQDFGDSWRRIVIRGVSSNFGFQAQTGVYIDEIPVSSVSPRNQIDLRTFDLERVEVLKGPQGTLFGLGSMGGTVRFITKNPQLDEVSGRADFSTSITKDGSPSQEVKGVVNLPLIEGELGLRISGTYNHTGGWIDQPALSKEDWNDQDLRNLRVKGLWRPTDALQVVASVITHHNDHAPESGEDENGNYKQSYGDLTTPSTEEDYDLYNLTISYDIGDVQLLSATSYIDTAKTTLEYGRIFQGEAPPIPFSEIKLSQFSNNTAFNQEVRIGSIGTGPWQWTVGGFYQDTDRSDLLLFYVAPDLLFDTGFGTSNSKSWAVFGDSSFDITDRFTLGGGLRYFKEDRESFDPGAIFGGTPLGGPTTQTGTFDSVSPRFYARYSATDEINIFASIAKGFRSGNFNSLGLPPAQPETLWSYELGSKMSLLDGRLDMEAALFYMDYQDYQLTGIVDLGDGLPISILSNAGTIEIKGVEWSFSWQTTENLRLSFNSNYTDARYARINATSTAHIVGDQIDFMPKYQYTLSADYDFSWHNKPAFARLDYAEIGKSTYRARTVGPWYYDESDVINMLNFNLELDWTNSFMLGMFVNNILNERGYLTSSTIEVRHSPRPRPRTVGVKLSVNF